MKIFNFFFLLFVTFWLFMSCGGNPEADGDKAYAKARYNQAINHYSKAMKSQPENPKIKEKIALTYMQKGLQLYKRTRNLESFTGNFDKGKESIPKGETSAEFNKEYSLLLYELARAYHRTTPTNEIQKEQYFTKTLDYLDEALLLDMNNSDADSLLDAIKTANFQKMFDRGVKFHKQAQKEKNIGDLFLSAEHYLKRAVYFDPTSEEAEKYLNLIRKKTMSIIDFDQDFPFAIADRKYISKYLLIAFSGINNIGEAMNFDPARLKLVDLDANEYRFDKEQTAKYEDGLINVVSLPARKQIDGTIAFAISKSIALKSLEYEMEDGTVIKKYFP